MRRIDFIVVHCTATPRGRAVTVDEIAQWHRQRFGDPSRGVEYHWVVGLNGELWRGGPESQVLWHAKGANAHGIGVVYVGGLEADGRTPADTRTAAQRATLRRLLRDLKARYPNARIIGHRDVPGTKKACPSFDAKTEYATL